MVQEYCDAKEIFVVTGELKLGRLDNEVEKELESKGKGKERDKVQRIT